MLSWQEVQNQIPHISYQTSFSKVLPVCANDIIKISKFNFSATISKIYAQFTSVNRWTNSAYFMLQQLFRKYFRFARMTSLNISKFNFTAAIDNINAQFAPVNRGRHSAYIMLDNRFKKYARYARMTS